MKKITVEQTAILSLCINIAYGVYNLVTGLLSHTWWYITLGLYFSILGIMRFSVLQIKRKADNVSDESFAKKFTGIMLTVLSVCLIGTVILSSVTERGVNHGIIAMIAIATYSFTKVTMAIINLVKARKNDSAVIKTLRSISFCDAFVSIASLQRSMLVTFSGMDEKSILILNIFTGSAVCLIVFITGLELIEGKLYKMAKSKIVQANKKIADTVVDGYKKIENAVVGGYTKIEDMFVDMYLTHDGETAEEAKERLKKQINHDK